MQGRDGSSANSFRPRSRNRKAVPISCNLLQEVARHCLLSYALFLTVQTLELAKAVGLRVIHNYARSYLEESIR
jgi:hypothetical protein